MYSAAYSNCEVTASPNVHAAWLQPQPAATGGGRNAAQRLLGAVLGPSMIRVLRLAQNAAWPGLSKPACAGAT